MEQAQPRGKPGGRNARRRGAEVLEFTLVLIPLLGMTTVLVDTAWAIFAQSTIQRAVRAGVRVGVTLTAPQMASGACLTESVKAVVQQNAMGLLNGASGLAKIKIHYFLPPGVDDTGPVVEVSANVDGNNPGNIMQVAVEGFSLAPLMPRIFMNQGPDKNPLIISVNSADIIEPSRQPPCIGSAP
jgi:hypothetical protein